MQSEHILKIKIMANGDKKRQRTRVRKRTPKIENNNRMCVNNLPGKA